MDHCCSGSVHSLQHVEKELPSMEIILTGVRHLLVFLRDLFWVPSCLFYVYINDIPSVIKLTTKIFADSAIMCVFVCVYRCYYIGQPFCIRLDIVVAKLIIIISSVCCKTFKELECFWFWWTPWIVAKEVVIFPFSFDRVLPKGQGITHSLLRTYLRAHLMFPTISPSLVYQTFGNF